MRNVFATPKQAAAAAPNGLPESRLPTGSALSSRAVHPQDPRKIIGVSVLGARLPTTKQSATFDGFTRRSMPGWIALAALPSLAASEEVSAQASSGRNRNCGRRIDIHGTSP